MTLLLLSLCSFSDDANANANATLGLLQLAENNGLKDD